MKSGEAFGALAAMLLSPFGVAMPDIDRTLATTGAALVREIAAAEQRGELEAVRLLVVAAESLARVLAHRRGRQSRRAA